MGRTKEASGSNEVDRKSFCCPRCECPDSKIVSRTHHKHSHRIGDSDSRRKFITIVEKRRCRYCGAVFTVNIQQTDATE